MRWISCFFKAGSVHNRKCRAAICRAFSGTPLLPGNSLFDGVNSKCTAGSQSAVAIASESSPNPIRFKVFMVWSVFCTLTLARRLCRRHYIIQPSEEVEGNRSVRWVGEKVAASSRLPWVTKRRAQL